MTTRRITFLLALHLFAGVAWADEAQTVETRMGTLKQKYPKTSFKSVAATHLPGVYEVVMGKNIAYVEPSGRYFIFGHLFDMETQKDLTEEKRPVLQSTDTSDKIDVRALPLADAIKSVRGNGERRLYVFSDPDCPYCKQLENALASVDNVTVYTFMFPIDSLHPAAKAKSAGVWCAKDRAKAWNDLMTRNMVPTGTCETPIDRNVALAEKLSIRGTPTLIFADGSLIPGALNAERINQLLAQVNE